MGGQWPRTAGQAVEADLPIVRPAAGDVGDGEGEFNGVRTENRQGVHHLAQVAVSGGVDVITGAELAGVHLLTVKVGHGNHVGQLPPLDVGEEQSIAIASARHICDRVVHLQPLGLLDDQHVRQGAAIFVCQGEGVGATGQIRLVVFHRALEVDHDRHFGHFKRDESGTASRGRGEGGIAVPRAADLGAGVIQRQGLRAGNRDGGVGDTTGGVGGGHRVGAIASKALKGAKAPIGIRRQCQPQGVGGRGGQVPCSAAGRETDRGDVLGAAQVVLRQFRSELDFIRRNEGERGGGVAARIGTEGHRPRGVHQRDHIFSVGHTGERGVAHLLVHQHGIRARHFKEAVFHGRIEAVPWIVRHDLHRRAVPKALDVLQHRELGVDHGRAQVVHLDETVGTGRDDIRARLEGHTHPERKALARGDLSNEGAAIGHGRVDGVRVGHQQPALIELVCTAVVARWKCTRRFNHIGAWRGLVDVGGPPSVVHEFR